MKHPHRKEGKNNQKKKDKEKRKRKRVDGCQNKVGTAALLGFLGCTLLRGIWKKNVKMLNKGKIGYIGRLPSRPKKLQKLVICPF